MATQSLSKSRACARLQIMIESRIGWGLVPAGAAGVVDRRSSEPQPASSQGRHRLTLPTDRSQYDREQERASYGGDSLFPPGVTPKDVISATPTTTARGDGCSRGKVFDRCNDPSAGSPTETLLRLLLPLGGRV